MCSLQNLNCGNNSSIAKIIIFIISNTWNVVKTVFKLPSPEKNELIKASAEDLGKVRSRESQNLRMKDSQVKITLKTKFGSWAVKTMLPLAKKKCELSKYVTLYLRKLNLKSKRKRGRKGQKDCNVEREGWTQKRSPSGFYTTFKSRSWKVPALRHSLRWEGLNK